jgi:hypothetical protein
MSIKHRGKVSQFSKRETVVHLRKDRSNDPNYRGMREGSFPRGDYDVGYVCGYGGYHSRYTNDPKLVTCNKCLGKE